MKSIDANQATKITPLKELKVGSAKHLLATDDTNKVNSTRTVICAVPSELAFKEIVKQKR